VTSKIKIRSLFRIAGESVTDLKAGVEAIMMGVFVRDTGTTSLLDIHAGKNRFEYCIQNRATSGKSPANTNDLEGMIELPEDQRHDRDINKRERQALRFQ
jgi:hypothetical protein